ncbi:MAG: metallophosphatase [Saprospiraceae bacterium]
MKRRTFLRQMGATTLLLSSGMPSLLANTAGTTQTLTILHTNDWHSRIEPFPEDGGRNAGMGGAVRRARMIEAIRAESSQVLLLDAGDIFQGTPYFNLYGGEPEFKLMSAMRYDAATIGNHDFDGGLDNLASQLERHATFSMLNCNYDLSDSPLHDKVQPWKVFRKGGLKIGVFGVGIELKGLVAPSLYGNIQYRDPIASANATALHLTMEEKCDLVICLSHLGYRYRDEKVSDTVLAQASEHIDIIIGGHTHTFLEQPEIIRNREQQPVIVNQVGWGGILLGRLDIAFSAHRGKRCINCSNEWV